MTIEQLSKAKELELDILKIDDCLSELNKELDIAYIDQDLLSVDLNLGTYNVIELEYTSQYIKDTFIPEYEEYLVNKKNHLQEELNNL